MFGPYAVEGEVARGARAVVLRARGPDGAQVALKLLTGASPEQRQRFGRERALLAELDETKGFVPLLDVLDTPHGPCLVMPFLRGGTLRERISSRGMAVHEVARLARRLAGSMARAHARGIVHRDLKPENILFDERGEALIADLGLAKRWGESSRVENSLTRTGELHGTPGYMAPEQIANARDVGPQADVFALGAILYECLTGVAPFSADRPLDALARTSSGTFVRVSEARPGTPDWLARIIERCLNPDPAQRFADGGSLAAAIAQGPLRGRRRSTPAALVGAVSVAALVAGLVLLGGGRPRPTAREGAAGPAMASSAEAPTPAEAEAPAPTEQKAPPEMETEAPPEPPSEPPPSVVPEPEPEPTRATEAPRRPRRGPARKHRRPAGEAPAAELLAPLDRNVLFGLRRMIGPTVPAPWTMAIDGEEVVLENLVDSHQVRYHYVTSTHAPPFRISVEVKVEALPGEPAPLGGGLVYGFDNRTKEYWAFVLTSDDQLKVYQRKRAFELRMSTGTGEPSPDGWRRIDVIEQERGFKLYIDGASSIGLGGPEMAPRRGVGVIAAGKGRFSFRRFGGAEVR